MADARIVEQTEITELSDGTYVIVDNDTAGTKKYDLNRVKALISNIIASDIGFADSNNDGNITITIGGGS